MRKKYTVNHCDSTETIKNDIPDDTEIDEKTPQKKKSVSIIQLYRYATWLDVLGIIIAVICATVSGICMPLMMWFFGDVTGTIVEYVSANQSDNSTGQEYLIEAVRSFAIYSSILGLVTVLLTFVSIVLFTYTCQRQIEKIRSLYMKHMLNQDISWYDTHQTGDFATKITDDLTKIEEGLSDRVSALVFNMAVFFFGIMQSLIKGWKLSLVCMVYLPASAIGMYIVSWLTGKFSQKETDAYSKASSIADEVLTSIRTVVAFGGQQKELDRYKEHLVTARDNNIKRSLFTAINNALMWFLVYGSYALSFYYGIKLIVDERDLPEKERVYTPGNMITVFFGVLMATWNFGQCAPYFQIFSVACASASYIYDVIDNVPIINLSKGSGKRLIQIKGNISFKNVYFQYPSRPEVQILSGVDMKINAGETVALVGKSGCGKSTCIQLIQRFYDADIGSIEIDDNDIRDLDLQWFRNHIGVVGQEPVLFAMTIAENIKLGNPKATEAEVERAAIRANAHSFIMMLPQGYDTLVGERGSQLSGGQKQRIAIARALIREPAILLLDEATSALDTHSEALVQKAIDSVSKDCTTIIVAHRLSTIRNANRIIVFSEGKVVEEGSHKDLMNMEGIYYNLVMAQVTDNNLINEEDELDTNNKSNKMEFDQRMSIFEDTNDVREIEKIRGSLSIFGQILKLNAPEGFHILLGCVAAIVSGTSLPIYSIVFGDIVGVLSNSNSDYVRTEGNKFSLYFLIIGITTGAAAFVQCYMFGIAGEKLTKRVRARMFQSMLKQDMGWYDIKENGVGALCAKLSNDASSVQGAAGSSLGTILNTISTLGLAMGFSFYFEWRLCLVTLSFVPLIFVAIYFEQRFVQKDTYGCQSALESSTKVAVEAISNIRTVTSLGCDVNFYRMYKASLFPHFVASRKAGYFRGVIVGLARSLMFFCYAVSIYYGVVLIIKEDLDYAIVFKVSEALITGAWSVGNVIAFSPNFQKGFSAANNILNLFNRIPKVRDKEKASSYGWGGGNIEYSDVHFTYPTRSNIKVLRGLNLSIPSGKTIALVGPSGCGKSTIVQLLERFYNPESGTVTVDQWNIANMKLSSLRSHMGIVSQEPILFDRTIAENIAYGDNTRNVPKHEIIEAAKNSNIHTFVTSLPLGYETRLGEKGTQLSGGQKQRIAIARALLRNPQVLLLDEATSALDTESEKVVQEALDSARKNRTCITIAHRLTTVQDADLIYVIDKGRVVEMGKHEELLSLKGIYYNLYTM